MARRRAADFGLSEELVRYGFVALTAFVLDILLLVLFRRHWHWNYYLSVSAAYVIGTFWNYFWSTRWAFAYRRLASKPQEPIIFWTIAILGMLATIGLMRVFRHHNIRLVWGKILSEIIIGVVGFSAKKLLLFTNLKQFREVLKWYRAAPTLTKLHLLLRRATLPIGRLLQQVPTDAKSVLEIGTGYGLILISLAEHRYHSSRLPRLAGTDIDEYKLEQARLAAATVNQPIAFTKELPPASELWQIILLSDLLYLLTPAEQNRLLDQSLARLAPGGRLLIKGMNHRPKWKFNIVQLQEFWAVKILRITERYADGPFAYVDMPVLAAQLEDGGYQTRIIKLDRGWIYPHLLLEVQKAAIVKS